VYNDKVASDHLRLDNLKLDAKTEWFNSIEIDFNKIVNEMNEFDEDLDIQFDEVSKGFDKIFYYLPKGSMQIVIFSGSALDAFGLPIERFKALVKGEKVTDIEKDLITWAFDITVNVMGSIFEKSKKSKLKSYDNAISIDKEYLNQKLAKQTVLQIHNNIANVLQIPLKDLIVNRISKNKKLIFHAY
ncbi:MAG: hypothetical protein Q8M94_08530, partial [Ignavibacteria bacterium]|nr:hypothetical protein [Ignavibacteria bacterium]